MKLKDDDVICEGDVLLYDDGEKYKAFDGYGCIGRTVSEQNSYTVKMFGSKLVKVTRKAPRISRKEYKRRALEAEKRIENALEYAAVILEGDRPWFGTDEVVCFKRILRGEE